MMSETFSSNQTGSNFYPSQPVVQVTNKIIKDSQIDRLKI